MFDKTGRPVSCGAAGNSRNQGRRRAKSVKFIYRGGGQKERERETGQRLCVIKRPAARSFNSFFFSLAKCGALSDYFWSLSPVIWAALLCPRAVIQKVIALLLFFARHHCPIRKESRVRLSAQEQGANVKNSLHLASKRGVRVSG